MKNAQSFTYLLLLMLLMGCDGKKEKSDNNIISIDVPIDRNDASGLFDSIFELNRYIVLETTDESLIRRLGKIVFYKSNLYVLDSDEKKILIFDDKGKYLKQYSHLGQGPGEYLSLTDFTLKEDTLYLLDRMGGQLLLYNLSDSLLDKRKVEKARGICVLGDDKYALNVELGSADNSSEKSYCSYAYFDKQECKLRDISYNKELCGLSYSLSEGSNTFYYYNDSVFTFFPYNDTIYCVDKQNGELSPYAAIQIGDEHIGMDDDKKRVDEWRKKISSSIFALYKWDDLLLFSYYYDGGNRKYVLVNKNTPKDIIFEGSFGLNKDKIPVRIVAYDSDKGVNELLSVTYPHELLGLVKHHGEKSCILKKMASEVVEEGNPVLVFYDLTQ